MICPSCKSDNISTVNKRGIGKLLKFLNPTTTHRCIGCGLNFNRFNLSFLIVLILVCAGAAGGWVLMDKLALQHQTEAPVNQRVSKAVPPPSEPLKIESQPIKITPPEPAVPPPKPMVQPPPAPIDAPPEVAGKTVDTQKAMGESEPEKKAQPVEMEKITAGTPEEKAPSEPPAENIQPEPAPIPKTAIAEIPDTKPETPPDKEPVTMGIAATSEAVSTPLTPTPETPSAGEQAAPQTLAAVTPREKSMEAPVKDIPSPTDLNKLIAIKVRVVDGENQILILADHPNIDYKYFFLDYPPRMVIDLPGNWEQPKSFTQNMKNDYISQIRLWKHDDKLRLVSDLIQNTSVTPTFKKIPEGLLVILK